MSLSHQTVGNIGLFYVCYRLSRLGWNVMPTSRNARGIDIVAYSPDSSRKLTFQVKSLSERHAVGLGKGKDNLNADFYVVCRYVQRDNPECFVLTPDEMKSLAHPSGKEKVSYWVEAPQYEAQDFRERWDKIGELAP